MFYPIAVAAMIVGAIVLFVAAVFASAFLVFAAVYETSQAFGEGWGLAIVVGVIVGLVAVTLKLIQ